MKNNIVKIPLFSLLFILFNSMILFLLTMLFNYLKLFRYNVSVFWCETSCYFQIFIKSGLILNVFNIIIFIIQFLFVLFFLKKFNINKRSLIILLIFFLLFFFTFNIGKSIMYQNDSEVENEYGIVITAEKAENNSPNFIINNVTGYNIIFKENNLFQNFIPTILGIFCAYIMKKKNLH